jgi:hypothetical protein
MPDLPTTLTDREYQKFVADLDGNTAVRIAPGAVTDSEGNELDIDYAGRAQMLDTKAIDNFRVMNETLIEIKILLKAILEG